MARAQVDIGWNNSDLKRGQKEALGVIDQFERKSNKNFEAKGVSNYLGKIGLLAGGFVSLNKAVDLTSESFQVFASFDALVKGLDSVTGSSAETEKQLARLREIAQKPGLGFREAVQGSIRLQSVGLSAEAAEKTLANFGNALALVGGSKADLSGVILALGQISAKGKVSAEEINQIAERIPQIRVAMQDAFGTADTEQLQKRGIGSEEFITKITEALGNLAKAGDSTKNQMDNLSDSIDQSKVAFGRWLDLQQRGVGIMDLFGKIMQQTADDINVATDASKRLKDIGTLGDIYENLSTGNVVDARKALEELNDEAAKKELLYYFEDIGTNANYAMARITALSQKFDIVNKAIGKGAKPDNNEDLFFKKLPLLLQGGGLIDAEIEIQAVIDEAVLTGTLDKLKSRLIAAREFAKVQVQTELPGSDSAEAARSMLSFLGEVGDNFELMVASAELAANKINTIKAETEAAATEAKKLAEATKAYEASASEIAKIQFELLSPEQQLAEIQGKLKEIFDPSGLDMAGLAKVVKDSLDQGDFSTAASAGKALVEAKKLQSQINDITAANVGLEEAEKTKQDARDLFRLETEIFRLRVQGNDQAADQVEKVLATTKELKRIQSETGESPEKAFKLLQERKKVEGELGKANVARANEIFAIEQAVLALRAVGQNGQADELERELELRRQAVNLQNPLNIKYEDALNLARQRSSLETAASQKAYQTELEILRLRASGKDKAADAKQRELDIQKEALEIQRQLNVSADEAIGMAKEERDLEDKIKKNEEEGDRRKISAKNLKAPTTEEALKRGYRPGHGIDGANFPNLDKQTFNGLEALINLQKNKGNAGLLDKAATDAAAKNVPAVGGVVPAVGMDAAIAANTERAAVALEKLGAQ